MDCLRRVPHCRGQGVETLVDEVLDALVGAVSCEPDAHKFQGKLENYADLAPEVIKFDTDEADVIRTEILDYKLRRLIQEVPAIEVPLMADELTFVVEESY